MSVGGEFERLARLAPFLAAEGEGVSVGIGDDAAVLRIGGVDLVICVDTIIEGVHFRRSTSSPGDVGWKVMAVNVSDVAAMGATPRAAVVALNRPADLSEADVEGMYAGLAEAGRRWGVAIVGGDTATAGEWSVSLTLLGDLIGEPAGGEPAGAGPPRVEPASDEASAVVTAGLTRPPVRRSGAQAGDVVLLAGRIGAAATALQSIAQGAKVDLQHLAAHRRPQALPATGRALAIVGATAMIDLSDGLGGDARHLCEASGVTLTLDAAAVRSVVADGVEAASGPAWLDLAVGGGEDFALLATLPHDRVQAALAAVAQAGETTATVIGTVTPPRPDRAPAVWIADGTQRWRVDHLGYDHG